MTILSEYRMDILGLLLLHKLSVTPDNKISILQLYYLNCAGRITFDSSKQLKMKCSLQARIPFIWHTNTSSFLIIPQVVALETAEQLLDLRNPVGENSKPLSPQRSIHGGYSNRMVIENLKEMDKKKSAELSYIAFCFKNTIQRK